MSYIKQQIPDCEGCEDVKCQACCEHEFDHDICIYCAYERDAGLEIDRAMARVEER